MHADLKVEVAADRDRIAGLPHGAYSLAGVDTIAATNQGRPRHVRIEVGAILAFAVDQEVVAVENRVIAGSQDLAVANGDQWRAAGRNDVESLVGPAAAAGGAEFTDRASGAVRALDGEDVAVVGKTTVGGN